jgi:hypothetical protein
MKYLKTAGFTLLLIALLFIFSEQAIAQCSLCKGAVESNMKGGGGYARGLYNGILYLIPIPYLAAALIAFLWFRNSRKAREKEKKVNTILQ